MAEWWVHRWFEVGGAVLVLSWIFWVIFSITLHELAHGWAAIWQGDDTPIRMGRMTANPLVHMGGMSLLMFAVVGIAWGLMPVDPSRFRWKRRGRIVVSGAGPAMNIALAFVALTAAALWNTYGPQSGNLADNVSMFLLTGGWLNIALALLNLLPVPPLDGASILMGLSFEFYKLFQKPQAQTAGFFILLVILISPIGGLFFAGAITIASTYVAGLAAVLP